MINFAHIAPVNYLHLVENQPVHLLLAHLVEDNKEYRDFYINLKRKNPNVFYHLDNSGFEMFQRNQPMYDSSKLIKMGKLVQADSIVMSDYPKQSYVKTIDAAQRMIPQLKSEGFLTFFCPQSEVGKIDDLMKSFKWAIDNEDINFIGLSILACPIALGLVDIPLRADATDKTKEEFFGVEVGKYLARATILQELNARQMLGPNTYKRFHCLGLASGPREIEVLKKYQDNIFSWDSSSAVWHGINGIEYDDSLTGLKDGKIQKEVDFDIAVDLTKRNIIENHIKRNLAVIDRFVGEND